MSHLGDSQRLKVCGTLVVTLEVTTLALNLGLEFCTLEISSSALILSIMSHLGDSQRLKVCCTLAVTLEVTTLALDLGLEFLHLGGFLLSTHPEYYESP